jgi:hypothetical protein
VDFLCATWAFFFQLENSIGLLQTFFSGELYYGTLQFKTMGFDNILKISRCIPCAASCPKCKVARDKKPECLFKDFGHVPFTACHAPDSRAGRSDDIFSPVHYERGHPASKY